MSENILQEADRIVSGDRRKAYGPVGSNFGLSAALWTAFLQNKPHDRDVVTVEDFGVMMILMKLARYSYAKKRDNLVDAAGYARTLEMYKEEVTPARPESVSYTDLAKLRSKPAPVLTAREREIKQLAAELKRLQEDFATTSFAPGTEPNRTMVQDQFDLAMRPLVNNEPFKQVEPLPSKPVSQTSTYVHRPALPVLESPPMFVTREQQVGAENWKTYEQDRGNISNVSDSLVPHIEPVNTAYLDLAYRAMSLDAPWLDTLAKLGPAYDKAIKELREMHACEKGLLNEASTKTCSNVTPHPKPKDCETLVSQKIRTFAGAVNQVKFNHSLSELIGADRMQLLRDRCAKANMIHTPALWFNQNLVLEMKKATGDNFLGGKERLLLFEPQVDERAQLILEAILGKELYAELYMHAKNMNIFTAFMALTDRMLQPPPPPALARGMWDSPPPPVPPVVTAESIRNDRESKYNQPIKTETGFDKTMTRKEYQLKYNLSPDSGVWKSELLKESP